MRKAILVLITSAFSLSMYAQDADFDSYKRIESDKVLNLSADQIAKIKKLNRETGLKFKAIGQSNLPGYEKGQRKRALALERKNAIRKILNEGQIERWENHYGNMDQREDLRDVIGDNYDSRLDQLEYKYEKEKDSIEDSSLPKYEKKAKLKDLKRNYKNEKNRLKNERSQAKSSGVLSK